MTVEEYVRQTFTEEEIGPYTMSAMLHCGGERQMRTFLERIKPTIVVETGTHHGFTTAVLAQHAELVYTFDPFDSPVKYQAWEALGVTDKIRYRQIKDDVDKANYLAQIPRTVDFAFIDGMHNMGGYAVDFHLLHRCGRLLFHDAVDTAHQSNFRWRIWEFCKTHPWKIKKYVMPYYYLGREGTEPTQETLDAAFA